MAAQPLDTTFITNTNSLTKKELIQVTMGIMRSAYFDEFPEGAMREWLDLQRNYNFYGTENYQLEQKCRTFLNLFLNNFDIVKEYPCFKEFKTYLPNTEARHTYISSKEQTTVFDLEKLIDSTIEASGSLYNFKPLAQINAAVPAPAVKDGLTSQINVINQNIAFSR